MKKQLTFDTLFTVTATGEMSLNAKELRAHVILGDLVKGMTSRKEGIKEMAYVYMMADPRSKYAHLNEGEREEATKKFIGALEGWKPGQNLIAAIDYYKAEVELSPTGKSFGASTKAMYEIGKDVYDNLNTISYLKDQLNKKLKVIQAKEKEASNEFEQTDQMTLMGECTKLVKECINVQKELIKQINDLPDLIETVENLASKWAKESNGTQEVYGGGTLGNRE